MNIIVQQKVVYVTDLFLPFGVMKLNCGRQEMSLTSGPQIQQTYTVAAISMYLVI